VQHRIERREAGGHAGPVATHFQRGGAKGRLDARVDRDPGITDLKDMLSPQIGAPTELVDLQLTDDARSQARCPQFDDAIDNWP